MPKTRTFIAVEISTAMRAAVAGLQQTLARCGVEAKWVDAESLHVTLVFLGDVDVTDLAFVCQSVEKAAAAERPFLLAVRGLGAFPTVRRPKILWAGLEAGRAELLRLHETIEHELQDLDGYRAEERPYSPHVTLARVQGEGSAAVLAREIPKYAAWSGGETLASEILVMSSELRRHGPEYAVIGRGPLLGKGPPGLVNK